MNAGIHSSERRLALNLPSELAVGATANVHSKLTFRVTLTVKNVDACLLSLEYDKTIFAEDLKAVKVTFTQKVEKKDLDFTLTPISRTTRPMWIEITAVAGTLIQIGGFFVTVTKS